MPAGRFGLYTLAGCLPWTAALALAGYGVGANWQHLEKTLQGPSYIIAGLVVVAIAVGVGVVLRRRRRGAPTGANASLEPVVGARFPLGGPNRALRMRYPGHT